MSSTSLLDAEVLRENHRAKVAFDQRTVCVPIRAPTFRVYSRGETLDRDMKRSRKLSWLSKLRKLIAHRLP
jgi:hypothetical protein